MSYVEDLQRGLDAVQAGHKAEARSAFRAVLRRQPTNETALLGLAYLAEDPRAGMAYVVRSLDAHPDSPRTHAALRWARKQLASTPPPPARGEDSELSSDAYRTTLKVAAGLALLMSLVIMGALVAWAVGLGPLEQPPAVAAVVSPPTPSATPLPRLSSLPPASATPSALPPTPTSPPIRTPVSDATPTPDPTPVPVPPSPEVPSPTTVPTVPVTEWRWIDVNLTHQVLVAYERDTPVRTIRVSTGLPHTPTPTGRFHIYVKYRADDMSGPGYYLADVPYVMYFYRGYGLHGTYWHDNFGHPMSHGCINLPTPEAEWLFNWATEGTLVNIHY